MAAVRTGNPTVGGLATAEWIRWAQSDADSGRPHGLTLMNQPTESTHSRVAASRLRVVEMRWQ